VLLYAHGIALIHGVGFLFQGRLVQEGLIKYALTDRQAWHGGLPALSLFPISFVAGLSTVLLSVISIGLVLKPPKSLWRHVVPVTVFLTGGGFVFIYIASVATASTLFPPKHKACHTNVGRWLLSLLLAWFPLSWILGRAFPSMMLEISPVTFVCFDILLPLAIILTHRLRCRTSSR
jgi:hypothetical protein